MLRCFQIIFYIIPHFACSFYRLLVNMRLNRLPSGKQGRVYIKENKGFTEAVVKPQENSEGIRTCELRKRDLELEETFQSLRNCRWWRTTSAHNLLSTLGGLYYSYVFISIILLFWESLAKANHLDFIIEHPERCINSSVVSINTEKKPRTLL